MSLMLVGSSIVTTLLIPPPEFQAGGEANGRALAFIAHRDFGDVFGTVYDLATITILWFAGASAMAGPAEPDPALPAALRHGAGVGARQPAAGADHHGDRLSGHRAVSTPTSTTRRAPTRPACWC